MTDEQVRAAETVVSIDRAIRFGMTALEKEFLADVIKKADLAGFKITLEKKEPERE
jgi:hypothetical protein